MNTAFVPDSRDVVLEVSTGRQAELGMFAREAEARQRIASADALQRVYDRFERGELRMPTFADPEPWEVQKARRDPVYDPVRDRLSEPEDEPYVRAGRAWRHLSPKIAAHVGPAPLPMSSVALLDDYFAGQRPRRFTAAALAWDSLQGQAFEATANSMGSRMAMSPLYSYFGVKRAPAAGGP